MEVGVSCIGCHDCLQEKSVQMEIIELLSSVWDAGSSQRSAVDLSLASVEPRYIFTFLMEKHVEIFEELANSVDCLLKKVVEVHGQVSKSLELPANNQYWKSEVLKKVLSNQHLEFEGIVNACSMKMFTKDQQPVGKRFRFMSNREEVANRLAERFNCQCIVEHAAFNNVNWTETERYTRVFARYFVRVLRNEAGHA